MTDSATPIYRFVTASRTDIGCVRKINEDSLLALPDAGLWLVADGMGGHAAGDFASQTIVSQMETIGVPTGAVDLHARFAQRLAQANRLIFDHARELGGGTIGSTLAALMVQQGHFACIWSGDSRVYRLRGGVLTRCTRDHTEVRTLLENGTITPEEAENWPRKNVITKAIGVTAEPDCEMAEGPLADGDTFLICSDGLTEYFQDEALERQMVDAGRDLEGLCDRLIAHALASGGKDNVSVVAVRCRQEPWPQMQADGVFPEFVGSL
ncbi:serine/threonine-protein phosphatase [Sulfitobacter albidus]|uniref:Serine/threonine-protein phosphatase n=1 Tax=Sulfitobacter albidus TaxID=2829501 RepID=A0A975JGP1_9RHOB|nr:protein phosphatase 2C domain-containing protein [Sulfitobacter albidus]QUJ78118.1 serine/threonine-protein phosphatase [Sulfitobacter albidus]